VAGLKFIKSKLKSAVSVTKIDLVKDVPCIHRLATLLADMSKTLDELLSTNKVKPPQKKPKSDETEDSVIDDPDKPNAPHKPTMIDASTDTILTPSWWDRDAIFVAEPVKKKRSRVRKPREAGNSQDLVQANDTEVESAMETDAEAPWSSVVKRGPTRQKIATDPRPPAIAEISKLPAKTKPPAKSKKPPAVLIRPAEGKSYSDTVRTVRSCGLTVQDIGANVTIRETRDGSLLLELFNII